MKRYLLGFVSGIALLTASETWAQQSLPTIDIGNKPKAKPVAVKTKPKTTASGPAQIVPSPGDTTGNANTPLFAPPIVKLSDRSVPIKVVNGTNYEVVQSYLSPQFINSYHIQETSPGQKSPYIGAFTGNQVDININGIRMNNALFRTGPNQYYGWIPDTFTKEVFVSDGGNIGGTINRELGVFKNQVSTTYNSAVNGYENTATMKVDKFSFAVNNINYGNIQTASRLVPNSSYNQVAGMFQVDWDNNNKTTMVYSESDDLPRTDRWNGGWKSGGYIAPGWNSTYTKWNLFSQKSAVYQQPSIYTWDLQRYGMINHKSKIGNLDLNLGYQLFQEKITDGTKPVQSMTHQLTAYGDYKVNDHVSLYSTNQYEVIMYDNGLLGWKDWQGRTSHDGYGTFKQGARFKGDLGPIEVALSGGYKETFVTGVKNPFLAPEASGILSYKGLFASYDRSANAPSYLMLKQAITTGKGTQLPNDNLQQEYADTFRVGFKWNGFYIDAYNKHLHDALFQQAVPGRADTWKTINNGDVNTYGTTLAYENPNILDTGIGIISRYEFAYGTQYINPWMRDFVNKTPQLITYNRLAWNGIWGEFKWMPKNNSVSQFDLEDVRMWGYNTGYKLLNVGYTGKYKDWDYTLSVNNIFNNAGRVWGSSVDVYGRNVQFSVRYNF